MFYAPWPSPASSCTGQELFLSEPVRFPAVFFRKQPPGMYYQLAFILPWPCAFRVPGGCPGREKPFLGQPVIGEVKVCLSRTAGTNQLAMFRCRFQAAKFIMQNIIYQNTVFCHFAPEKHFPSGRTKGKKLGGDSTAKLFSECQPTAGQPPVLSFCKPLSPRYTRLYGCLSSSSHTARALAIQTRCQHKFVLQSSEIPAVDEI